MAFGCAGTKPRAQHRPTARRSAASVSPAHAPSAPPTAIVTWGLPTQAADDVRVRSRQGAFLCWPRAMGARAG
eukprot:8448680-Lingulodinium_polyedra.AAC.1